MLFTIPVVADNGNTISPKNEPRIVGGKPANAAEWGFYTQIVSRYSNRSYCGASYLGDGYVLTAAHCVDGDAPNQIAVKVGGMKYNGTDGQRVNVSNIYIHPNFNSRNLDNDIAVLKLDRIPVGAQMVEIAQGSLTQYAGVGDWLTVAGLGRTQEGGSSPSVLMEVDVPLVSDATCRTAGGSYTNVGAVSFCAGLPQGGKDSCQGDSGGPIVVNRSGTITQLGVVSWGIGCARPGKYGVYSDIAALRSWVDSVIASPSGSISVGYTKQQTLAGFKVGEIKTHTFELTNTGTTGFTVTNIELGYGGVALRPVISRDTCSATTLNASQACSVAIEFGASAAGAATVALNFSTDKATTVYTANISAVATDSGNSGTCDGSWDPVKVYNKGDKVKWAGKVWQAQWWTQGDNPSDSGPWGVWQEVGLSNCGAK
ncbi:trypsin [Photobacterium proteolyticum]|uniref:Trypsin n=1 Tax=Photobacterium proteolyticum TaxID=1903952 RepID=A0A1Q9GSS7_9GAMM|nr:trypsin-like serine protease [Photobacterium proteolyticum]OLQ77752.1 trypsin [Photobacterium proteolyticum]